MDTTDIPAVGRPPAPRAGDRLRTWFAILLAVLALLLALCWLLYRHEAAAVERRIADQEMAQIELLAELLDSDLQSILLRAEAVDLGRAERRVALVSRLRVFDALGDAIELGGRTATGGASAPAAAAAGSLRAAPERWARMLAEPRGQLIDQAGLLSWRRVTLQAHPADLRTAQSAAAFLVIATELPAADLASMLRGLRRAFAWFACGLAVLLVCSFWIVHSRRSALSRLRRNEADPAVTLQSIGDAVMATDTAGRITPTNRVAEQLTGWNQAQASGRPIAEVPRIVNQETRDIMTEHEAARALRDSEMRYRGLFESIDEGFCIIEMLFDADGKPVDYRFLEINPAFERQTGLRDAQGKRMRELAPEHEAHWFEVYGRIARTGAPLRFQNRAEQLNRTYDVYAFRIGDPQQHHVAILVNDISERQRAQTELDRFFSLSLDLLCISSGDGYFKRVSPAVTAMLGWSVEEFLARPYIEQVHPDDRAATQREVERQMRSGEKVLNFENRYLHKDGSWRVLSWRSVPQGELMYATARDVTDYRQLEQSLRQSNEQLEQKVQERTAELQAMNEQLLHSERRFRALIEHAAEGISVVDDHHDFSYISPGVVAIEGYSESDLAGHPLFENVHADDLVAVRQCLERAGERPGEALPLLWRRRHKDGRWLWLEGFVTNLQADTAVHGMVINYRDITHRHMAEQKLRKFAESLERSNRDLQDFAHVVSHDLQEPLRKILMFGERLAARCGHAFDDTGRDFMQRMLSAAERSRRLIADLLTYSRVSATRRNFQRVDLSEVAREVVSDLEATLDQYGGTVEIDALPTIEAHPTQLRQLLQNLIGNALKFRRPDVPARVSLTCKRDDTNVILFVSDNGIGFDDKYAERIFEVFQRLVDREAYDGSGIGLSVCRKIVEAHGGSIVASSRVGHGSTFIVTLPLSQASIDMLAS